MAIWTYVRNADPKSKITGIELQGGLILYIHTYANLSAKQLEQIYSSGLGIVIEEGIIPPATEAGGGGGGGSSSSVALVKQWAKDTEFLENQLVVSPEGELLRTLRNFTSGESYVF